MDKLDELWKCASHSVTLAPSISRMYGLQIYKTLVDVKIEPSVDLLRKCCYYCGSIYFPTKSCDVQIVSKKELKNLKKEIKIFHSEEIMATKNVEALPRCSNFVLYHCLVCQNGIVFRGTNSKTVKENEEFLEQKKNQLKRNLPNEPSKTIKPQPKMMKRLISKSNQSSFSLNDFLSAV